MDQGSEKAAGLNFQGQLLAAFLPHAGRHAAMALDLVVSRVVGYFCWTLDHGHANAMRCLHCLFVFFSWYTTLLMWWIMVGCL